MGNSTRSLWLSGAFVMAVVCGSGPKVLAEHEPADDAPNFSTILVRQQRETFRAVAKYVATNPQADDVEQAYRWLFEAALTHGLESEALKLAETFLERESSATAVRRLAQQVRTLGLARAGRLEDALSSFDESLRSVRLRSANETIELAVRLAAQTQLAGDIEATRQVYERLSSAFFLNPQVREFCEARRSKLELIGRPAPQVDVNDLDGNAVDLSVLRGRVVLIDFWATNCAPCLEEFPQMKRLYADFRSQGLEIIGVSLDESADRVEQFQQQWQLPWRLVMDETSKGAFRRRYRVPKIPSVYLIDQQGRIAYSDLFGQNLRAAVKQLLEKSTE